MFRFTPKPKENVVRLMTNASTIVFGGLIIGPFIGESFRHHLFMVGLLSYIVCAILIWFLES